MAWGLVILMLGALGGCSGPSAAGLPSNIFGDKLSERQYNELRPGQAEQDVVNSLQETGRAEDQVAGRYRRLFPAHSARVGCTFWQIGAHGDRIVRLCFTSPGGRLVQKLERRIPLAKEN